MTIKKLHDVLSRFLIAETFGAFPLADTMQLNHMLRYDGTKKAGMIPAVSYRNKDFDVAKVGRINLSTKQFSNYFSW